jgi:hypothetical protein
MRVLIVSRLLHMQLGAVVEKQKKGGGNRHLPKSDRPLHDRSSKTLSLIEGE